ncbi:MAG TPA: hypothetical protein VH641_14875 [Streptosporangiaceae bacterium]|jgi:hypothetical protein
MRRIGWPFWAALAAAAAGWVVAGICWGGRADGNLLYNIAAITACAAALLFIGVYTVLGVTGPAKWWRNDLGSLLVLAVASQLPMTGTITWAVLFHGGLVNTLPLAWALIGGTWASALVILALTAVWLRINLASRKDPGRDT